MHALLAYAKKQLSHASKRSASKQGATENNNFGVGDLEHLRVHKVLLTHKSDGM